MIKCDPRARARCPFKKPCGGDDAAYSMEGSKCDEFNKQVLAPPPTNADRIRAMSDEELARFLCEFRSSESYGFACSECVAKEFCHDGHTGMINWLQQPVEEG